MHELRMFTHGLRLFISVYPCLHRVCEVYAEFSQDLRRTLSGFMQSLRISLGREEALQCCGVRRGGGEGRVGRPDPKAPFPCPPPQRPRESRGKSQAMGHVGPRPWVTWAQAMSHVGPRPWVTWAPDHGSRGPQAMGHVAPRP
jgi:hypothetical protein